MTNTSLDLKELGLAVLNTADSIAYQGGDAGAVENMPTMAYDGSLAQASGSIATAFNWCVTVLGGAQTLKTFAEDIKAM